MKITVTQEHIDLGKQGDCIRCPIALAMIDAGLHKAVVRDSYVIFTNGSDYPLPVDAATFIRRFDNNIVVKPFEFELDIPCE